MKNLSISQWIYVGVIVALLGTFSVAGMRGWMVFGTGSQHATRGVAPVGLMHK